MNPSRLWIALLWLLAACCPLSAMFEFEQQETIPVDRLISNLTARATSASETNKLQYAYWLARVHSIAYATNLPTMRATTNQSKPEFDSPYTDIGIPRAVQPVKGTARETAAHRHLTNAIAWYITAKSCLRKFPSSPQAGWWVLPIHLGHAWCLDQAGRRPEALEAYRETLAIAWQKEVVGEFHLNEWLRERWDDIKALRNPLKGPRRKNIDSRVCYSKEAIAYMLKLLDPEQDHRKVKRLLQMQKELNAMPIRIWITPLVVPMYENAAFADLVRPQAGVRFNLDGFGPDLKWGWITSHAAWLVYDGTRSGRVTSGRQLLGAVTFWVFWEDAYQVLDALDDDADGMLEGAELAGLALWRDGNANGTSEPGEVQPVEVWGISALSTRAERHALGFPWNPRGVRFGESSWRPTYDWITTGSAEVPRQ